MKKLIMSILCVFLSFSFLIALRLYANDLRNDFFQDPNNYPVLKAFTAFPNVPEINDDPNIIDQYPSQFCYACHNAEAAQDIGTSIILGDDSGNKKKEHHPMGTQASLMDTTKVKNGKFIRAPGTPPELLNKNGQLTCTSCHDDFHGWGPFADSNDIEKARANFFLRWEFNNGEEEDKAEFCLVCHNDKTTANLNGKHLRTRTDAYARNVTRIIYMPDPNGKLVETEVGCANCMFCHFIHEGYERQDTDNLPGVGIRPDVDSLMRVSSLNLAWGDRPDDTDLYDYEDMCYGCHGDPNIVKGTGPAGSLLQPAGYFTHRYTCVPNANSPTSSKIKPGGTFPLSDGPDPETQNDYGTKTGHIFCGTCHNVHKGTNQPYLRSDHSPYEAYGFCEACHDKDGEFVSKSHPIGLGPNPDPAQGAPTAAQFADTYNGGGALFSQGGSGNPGGITSPFNTATGKSTQSGSGKVICLTCHNTHAAVTSWEGKTETDMSTDHGYLLVKDNMRQREDTSPGSELCKACHPFGDSEYSFPEGTHGDNTLSGVRDICKECHIPHNATGPKLWARECFNNGCYSLGPFQGVRQLCFTCHCCNGIAPTGSETVFKGINLGNPIPGNYLEDHVMRNWADIEGVGHYDPNCFPLDPSDKDVIPKSPKSELDTHNGFYCGSCHNPHKQPYSKRGGSYLRSKDGNVGFRGYRKDFCNDCHIDAHHNEKEKDDECINCHHPHEGLTKIDEEPDVGRLIIKKGLPDMMAPKLTGQDPHPGAKQVSPNSNIVFHIEDSGAGVDINSIELFVQGINVTPDVIIATVDKDNHNVRVIYDPVYIFQYGESVQVSVNARDLAMYPNAMEGQYQFKVIEAEKILTEHLINERCWYCHQDMYPDMAPNPNNPVGPNLSCFTNPMGMPYPLYYSTLGFEPNKKFFDLNPSENFTNSEIYEPRKKGHLSHLVYQPFGLGRWCLDCHDSTRYTQGDPNTPHPSDHNVYFKDGNKLNQTSICKDCHGGLFPKGSEVLPDDPKIDPNSVRLLQWGDPGSVTCLQCHDDSYEHGRIYASYISRYSSDDPDIILDPNHDHFYHDWYYNDTNGCLITAPDPDKVPRQNYWSKSGHGITAQENYKGATLDTGYPDPDRPYPNKGAMNSKNIPIDPNDPDKHSRNHDLNLNPNDGRKNFCWECHWSNETVRETICVESLEYPEGFPIGKYNGHLDTIDYRDERWGPAERSYPETCMGHKQWETCRECHPTKYSHFVYKELGTGRRRPGPIQRFSHCIVCHNPHGSGDENGNANVFMIKGRIYKYMCNNCHFSQFQVAPCSPYPSPGEPGSFNPDPNMNTWVVNFFDPLIQDICDPLIQEVCDSNSPENSISIPADTKDICEVCHQDKARQFWPTPGDLNGDEYKHRNGSGHYFNPYHPDPCPDPDDCTIDYRGTDCTGCHIHDPGPAPDPNDYDEISNSGSAFNSKAFAPTCRCHGIGRIDITTLEYDPNVYQGEGPLPDIAGKGHGTPPPPFPVVDPGLPEKDPNHDVHSAHTRYNFPCLRCHIDPDDLSYDPDTEYIFKLDDNTPIGFDQYMNPNGIYEESVRTCSNLYCHSNGKGNYADPITWSGQERFCRDPNDLLCIDTDGHFKYCDSCHKTPPDPNDTYHSGLNTSCDTCHPHNGIYEGNPGFYKHVNSKVDFVSIKMDFSEGWSMISLPMLPNNPILSALFPEAIVVYKFEREFGYLRVNENEELQIGDGYWILFNKDQDYVFTAQPICSYSKKVYSAGWEMIGGCACSANASLDNGNINVTYKYLPGKGYVQLLESENLEPGEGYWILVNDITDKVILRVKCLLFLTD